MEREVKISLLVFQGVNFIARPCAVPINSRETKYLTNPLQIIVSELRALIESSLILVKQDDAPKKMPHLKEVQSLLRIFLTINKRIYLDSESVGSWNEVRTLQEAYRDLVRTLFFLSTIIRQGVQEGTVGRGVLECATVFSQLVGETIAEVKRTSNVAFPEYLQD